MWAMDHSTRTSEEVKSLWTGLLQESGECAVPSVAGLQLTSSFSSSSSITAQLLHGAVVSVRELTSFSPSRRMKAHLLVSLRGISMEDALGM